MNHRSFWPVAFVAGAVTAPAVSLALPHSPVRSVVVLAFLLVCPGMAVVRPLRLATGATELLLAVLVSLAIETVLALVMVYAHLWSPPVLLVVVAVACGLAGRAELVGAHRAIVLEEA
jgi:uncharacterized membrane protein